VEEDVFADALGGEIGWDVAEVKRRRAWWARAGAGNNQRGDGGEDGH
jgi:hypothetical protein